MKNLRVLSAILISSTFFAGCAHHRDVRPHTSGLHNVSFLAERREDGYKEAFKQAGNFCEERYGLHPVIVSESSEYVGSMQEDSYNQAKTVTEVVSVVGIVGSLLGGSDRDRDVGTVAAIGGQIANEAIGDGYRFNLGFRCE